MTQAIFLAYASQDAEAARRICDALRAAGLEVWFDQSELRGGDAWDASIRKLKRNKRFANACAFAHDAVIAAQGLWSLAESAFMPFHADPRWLPVMQKLGFIR